MSQIIAGIDEAGRGSVFGPLIIVGVTFQEDILNQTQGIKDSKLFQGIEGRKEREKLAKLLQDSSIEYKVEEITAIEIDNVLDKRPKDNLNLLEIRAIGRLILGLSSETVKIDTISTPKYTMHELKMYFHSLGKEFWYKRILTKHGIGFSLNDKSLIKKSVFISKKADQLFPIVSVASIIAKFIRDQKLREIERQEQLPENTLGLGYPNVKDKNLMNFFQQNHKKIYDRKYTFIRYNWEWKPLQDIIYPKKPTLDEYI